MTTRHADPQPDDTLTRGVIDALDALDHDGKREVLTFSHDLARRRQASGLCGALLAFAGAFSADDLARMEQAIADACETVDPATW